MRRLLARQKRWQEIYPILALTRIYKSAIEMQFLRLELAFFSKGESGIRKFSAVSLPKGWI